MGEDTFGFPIVCPQIVIAEVVNPIGLSSPTLVVIAEVAVEARAKAAVGTHPAGARVPVEYFR